MFDLSMLKGAAARKSGKPMGPPSPPQGKPAVSVEIETDGEGPAGDVAAKLAACAKKYGVSPEQLLADFEEFEAQKYGDAGGDEMPDEPPAEA